MICPLGPTPAWSSRGRGEAKEALFQPLHRARRLQPALGPFPQVADGLIAIPRTVVVGEVFRERIDAEQEEGNMGVDLQGLLEGGIGHLPGSLLPEGVERRR